MCDRKRLLGGLRYLANNTFHTCLPSIKFINSFKSEMKTSELKQILDVINTET